MRFALLTFLALSACASRPGPTAAATSAPSASATSAPAPVAAPRSAGEAAAPPPPTTPSIGAVASGWRARHRIIDLHMHVEPTLEHMGRAVRIMDAVGVGLAVNLSGGTVTHAKGQPSDFELTKKFTDEHFPGRFVEYMNLDYADWDAPNFAAEAVAQVEEGARLGAAGYKEFKRLGLGLRDKSGRLLKVDDPKLDPMWRALGRLGMPVSIHVADPKAFWAPNDSTNERWKELKDHPRWWFGDPKKYPPREDLLAALERVVARHPETTFVCVHFGNNAEDIDWVDRQLDAHPNMLVDIAARVPEIGRHDPERVHAFFVKHQDRILFATDFQVYDRMTLGSGGLGPPPTDDDAIDFFQTHWRFFETADKGFPHMTPIQGDWTIDAIHLPADVLAKVYFGNAEKLLARSLEKRLPPPAGD
ncbi:MAG TPA: amidohydrolase family protein [Polyangiaceae bacterium]|nr:amidohydrolase family protein [Polyangiaceae bacterium]